MKKDKKEKADKEKKKEKKRDKKSKRVRTDTPDPRDDSEPAPKRSRARDFSPLLGSKRQVQVLANGMVSNTVL